MTAPTRTSAYDQYADEYAADVATREQDDLVGDPFGILTPLLAQLGDVTGQDVLDAGCGEGYLPHPGCQGSPGDRRRSRHGWSSWPGRKHPPDRSSIELAI